MELILPLAIGAPTILLFVGLNILLAGFSIFLIGKFEKGIAVLLWILAMLFFPFVGTMIYLIYHLGKRGFSLKAT